MSTVDKAISLLELFSAEEPEIGLSELARRAEFDKATTRRLLVSLADHGLVEQDAITRNYRLGAGLSRLARLREAHFPFLQVALPVVRELALHTSETVHLAEFSRGGLATIHVEESSKANRVSVAVGQLLPLHATASGIAFLAFSRPEFVNQCLGKSLKAFTAHTLTSRSQVLDAIKTAAQRGYSHGGQGFDEGVSSVAAAILAPDGFAIGTISIASPLARVSAAITRQHGEAAVAAARSITSRLFGEPSSKRHAS